MRHSPDYLPLDYLRRQAKRLKRACKAGDAAALARVAPYFGAQAGLKHSQALHVIAREQGYPSWPRLKLAAETAGMDRAARAERLKIALYLGQGWIVDDLLAADPSLTSANFGLACALYDLDLVRATLASDSEAAVRSVGIRTPILHLTFSRYHRIRPELAGRSVEVAEALVAAGADVNDGYPSEPGSEHRLSALYGALGHAGNLPLAEWLLERGADPNDNESLYHATELPTLDGVRLLLRHGVRTAGTNALARMLDFDNYDGARLLLDYGADPNEPVAEHPSGEPAVTVPALHQAARRGRDGRFAELLLAHGADANLLWKGHTAYGFARIYGNRSFAGALEKAGHASPLTRAETILAACADGTPLKGRPLAGLALDEEEKRLLTQVILWPDRFDHARALVAAGIDPNVPEEMDMPPIHLAGWAGLPDQVSWLLTLEPDLSHVNAYGGDLVSTIIHGSENRLDSDERDHVACLRLALEAGAPLKRAELRGAMNEDVVAFLQDWAEAHPERIVEEEA